MVTTSPSGGHATIADGGDVAEVLSKGASNIGTPKEFSIFLKHTVEATTDEEEDDARWTTWEILCTIYLPILLIWLRRSMFGTAHVVRSLLWGQFLRILIEYLGTQQERSGSGGWLLNRVSPWIQPWLEQQQQQHHHHKAADSTFPPALTALAILAFMLCVVHPDGFTWIMLGKLRDDAVIRDYNSLDGIMAFVHSSAACWATAMHDYGIIPTLFASLTLAALGCLIGIIVRTLTPKTCPSKRQPKNEKHKKKKRGKHHSKRHSHHGKRHSRTTTAASKAIPEDEPCAEEPIETKTAATTIGTSELTNTGPVTPKDEPVTNGHDMLIPSVAKTTNVSVDDHSCDDTASVRSFGSAPTAVTISSEASLRSGSVETGSKTPSRGGKATGRQLHGSKKHGKKLALDGGDVSTSTEKSMSRVKNLQPRPINSRAAEFKKATNHRRGGQKKLKTTNHRPTSTISATPSTMTTPEPHPQQESSFFSSPSTNTISPYAQPFVPAAQRTQQPSYQGTPVQHQPPQEPLASPFPGGLGPIGVNATPPVDAIPWWTTSKASPPVIRENRGFVRPPPGLAPIRSTPPTTQLPFFPSPPRAVQTAGSFSTTYNLVYMNDSLAPYGYGDGMVHGSQQQQDEESRIEAELQELGGQMVGSVLDF